MKRYDICIDLPSRIKNVREYIEKRIKGSNVVVYLEVELHKIYPAKVKDYETK